MSNAWSGDWKARVRERVNRLGFDSLPALASAHPGVPFGQLFRLLRETESPDDTTIGYIQFQALFFEEAEANGRIREAIADTLVRRLRQHLRSGWNRGQRLRERKAEARAKWELPPSRIPKFGVVTDKIWDALRDLNPPDDWCPADCNDPIIQEAFRHAWPEKD